MADFKAIKHVGNLPTGSNIEPDCVYLHRVGDGFDLYCSNSQGNALIKHNEDNRFINAGQYGVRTLTNVASLFNQSPHTRMWRVVTGIRKSDYHMFDINLKGYSYGGKGYIDIKVGAYSYANSAILNPFALSSGTLHCGDAWLGFDSSNRLNIFTGLGISKYYAGVSLDAQLFYGADSALPVANNPDNWQILGSPSGSPGNNTTWSGITNIVRVPVVQK